MTSISGLWEWYIAGPLIGLFVPLSLYFGNKMFGISSTFTQICSAFAPRNLKSFFTYDHEKDGWKVSFVTGILLGGYISQHLLNYETVRFLPDHYYSLEGYVTLFFGGILVGFGTRYANGCTSGHSITGISTLQLSGLVATISFFIGGLLLTYAKMYLG